MITPAVCFRREQLLPRGKGTKRFESSPEEIFLISESSQEFRSVSASFRQDAAVLSETKLLMAGRLVLDGTKLKENTFQPLVQTMPL